MNDGLTLSRIAAAEKFLRGRIRRTPVEPSPGLSALLGVPVWLKLESLQLTGSFKIRGAFFRLSRVTEAERRSGIVTCSAGNHGKACAYAGRKLDVPTTIYVPSTIDEAKYRGMRAQGVEVVISRFPGFDETEEWAQDEARRGGRPFISAYDDYDVMAANGGTTGLEIVDELPQVTNFIVPVGGGGLSAGLSLLVKERVPGARIIGCQHEDSPALKMSIEQGAAVTRLPGTKTLAAGVEGGIGIRAFDILRTRVDHVGLVSDEEISVAMRWILDEHQYLIEPTAAVVVAACLHDRIGKLTGPAIVVVSGRNVSLTTIRTVLCT
jgi:threonine dehydratase